MTQVILDPAFEELQRLLRRRDDIDRAITALERIRLPGLHLRQRMKRSEVTTTARASLGCELDFAGMTLASAIIMVLDAAGQPLGNAEIVDALIRGRLRFRGTNPPLAVAQALSRMQQTPGPILKLGRGRWTIDRGFQYPAKLPDASYSHEVAMALA